MPSWNARGAEHILQRNRFHIGGCGVLDVSRNALTGYLHGPPAISNQSVGLGDYDPGHGVALQHS
jgi:hypothetical protein